MYCSAKCCERKRSAKRREYKKKWQTENRVKGNAYAKKYVEKNRIVYNERARLDSTEARRTLRDTYIKKLLTQHHPLLRGAEIPPEIILQKLESIKLKRLIHEKSRQINAH